MSRQRYDTDLSESAWERIVPLIPAALEGGRPRSVDMWEILNAIFYVLQTEYVWRRVLDSCIRNR
jgi:putative transposase